MPSLRSIRDAGMCDARIEPLSLSPVPIVISTLVPHALNIMIRFQAERHTLKFGLFSVYSCPKLPLVGSNFSMETQKPSVFKIIMKTFIIFNTSKLSFFCFSGGGGGGGICLLFSFVVFTSHIAVCVRLKKKKRLKERMNM